MVKLNIKKFSRSKNDIEIIDTAEVAPEVAPAKKRGRKPKQQPEPELIESEPEVEIIEPEPEPEVEIIEPEEEDNNFLEELNNENFVETSTKPTPKNEPNETAKIMKEMFKKPKKEQKLVRDDDSLFGVDATPILGKDKRVLIAKIH
jgi:hypothetical protein